MSCEAEGGRGRGIGGGGDYLTAKCTVGRPRWTGGLLRRQVQNTHPHMNTHGNKRPHSLRNTSALSSHIQYIRTKLQHSRGDACRMHSLHIAATHIRNRFFEMRRGGGDERRRLHLLSRNAEIKHHKMCVNVIGITEML